jgi:hypothetical protein
MLQFDAVPGVLMKSTLASLAVILWFGIPGFAQATTYKVVYQFKGFPEGSTPAFELVEGPDQALYGVTLRDGAYQAGTVFRLARPTKANPNWTETTIHDFGSGMDGIQPSSGLVFDAAGNLYGATEYGGSSYVCQPLFYFTTTSCGTIYRLSPPQTPGGSWSETILYSFSTSQGGFAPAGKLLLDKSGNIFGTVQTGGGGTGTAPCAKPTEGCGAVFKLTPKAPGSTTYTQTNLFSFADGPDGAIPAGGVIADGEKGLIGTTLYGGSAGNSGDTCGSMGNVVTGCGVVFRLVPGAAGKPWTETILYTLNGSSDAHDGWSPNGNILALSPRKFVFSTSSGPSQTDQAGTIFSLTAPQKAGGSWSASDLYNFTALGGAAAIYMPVGQMVWSKNGLYGVTFYAGTSGNPGNGIVFRLSPGTGGSVWRETTVHGFIGTPRDGDTPLGGLMTDSTGAIFGTTGYGGEGAGTVFKIEP